MISLEEVYNITFSPLVTTLFAVQWTSNNGICVITEKGIHVFELIPSPMNPQPNIKFSRSFIYASDILPAYAFINEITSLSWNIKRREVYSLLMEAALVPKIDDATNILPKIVRVSWSPENLIHPSKCMLAIITSVGAVELLHQVLRNWFSICDISSIWLQTVEDNIKSNFDSCKNEESRFTKIQENLRQLQACAMTWSELFKLKDTYYAYFVTAFRSSDIVIWKIHKVSDSSKNMKPIIISRIKLNINTKINVLLWCTIKPNTYLIIIGCCNGQIQGILYSNNNKCFENTSIEKYYTYPDRVSVNSLLMVSQNENRIQFIACKGFFLLLFGLTITGKLMYTHYLQIEGFTISGISVIASECILITTQNGLACSPNRTMLVCITSPNSTYDHLITREPSVLYILSLDGEEWDPINIIKNYKDINSNFPWDCFELIRLKAAKVSDPMIVLPKMSQNLESLKLYELRISMWLSLITEVLTKKKMIQRIENIGEIAEAQPLIFVHCACAYLNRLTDKKHLSKDQELSASLLRMYLEIYLAGEDTEEETVTTQYVRQALNKTSHFKLKVESCNLCGQIINDLSWNTTKCPSGHKLPRCALTLLQITTVQYRSCPICGQLYHLCLDEEYEEVRCLFCNIPVLYDSRVLDIQNSELYTRNLSKPQVSLVELTQNQDSEISENFSYTEEHQTEAQSYSVVVNYDKDESCSITETWREF
ncbi:uncharacterized protein LOC118444447 isoform X2 [Vespa mandarinia]|uniref:uncharacterized protein LOC118444447 isoform X2 n=1 Tax=Vespa mandarinia TaxID=7446 RepID=UPI00161744D0|nr:uncharacterized protein LOC118444447 isoform X2 [Vespa mandarinia]